MSNPRSASNAWAKIKGKLALTTPEGGAVTTPKKGGAKKKAAAKGDSADGEGADGESPTKKTPRKRVAKKQEVDGEASPSPRKKGRAAKGQKGSDDETGSYSLSASHQFHTNASQQPMCRRRSRPSPMPRTWSRMVTAR